MVKNLIDISKDKRYKLNMYIYIFNLYLYFIVYLLHAAYSA